MITPPDPISAANREEAKELCAKATPGPLDVINWSRGEGGKFRWSVVNPKGDAELGNWLIAECWWEEDARALAFSRTAIPSYEARVVELEAALAAKEATIDSLVGSSGKMAVRAEQLEDTLAKRDIVTNIARTTSVEEIIDWLDERRANCERLAAGKTGDDKMGWLEDAAYFEGAVFQFRASEARATALLEALRVVKYKAGNNTTMDGIYHPDDSGFGGIYAVAEAAINAGASDDRK